jgi:hypothetical protein
MRKYPPLRPMLYAEEIKALAVRVSSAAAIDFDGEAERISRRCGMSRAMALRDFQKSFWHLWQGLPAVQACGAIPS